MAKQRDVLPPRHRLWPCSRVFDLPQYWQLENHHDHPPTKYDQFVVTLTKLSTAALQYILRLRRLVLVSLLCHIQWILLDSWSGAAIVSPSISSMISGVVSLLAVHEVFSVLFLYWPWLVSIADAFIILLATVLYVYRYTTGFFVDYSAIHLNVGLITYGESFSAVPQGTMQTLFLGVSMPVFTYLILRAFVPPTDSSAYVGRSRFIFHTVAFFLACVWLQWIIPGDVQTTEAITEVFRSMWRKQPEEILSIDAAHLLTLGIDVNEQYPLYNPGPVPAKSAAKALPHVLLIVLESFGAVHINRTCTYCDPKLGPNVQLTPNVYNFAQQSAWTDIYYSNSIQTPRAQVAMLCGINPSWRQKIFSSYPDMNLRCLPKVLTELGYHTLLWSGQENVEFDNTRAAMQKLVGIQDVQSMNINRASGPEKHWGMGWQDDDAYKSFFQYLDQQVEASDKPLFAVLTTISHHMHFDSVPEKEKSLFGHMKTTTLRHHFDESIHVADRYFATFVAELESRRWLDDAIVIVTGDHAYPNGEHWNFYNDFGAYEENFRVPLIIKAPKAGVKPGKLQSGRSHVDLAPTILDLLDAQAANSYFGSSVLTKHKKQKQEKAAVAAERPAIMVQPYNGMHFVAVRHPYKLRYDFQAKIYVLTDLHSDPLETKNLYGAPELQDIQKLLEGDLCIPLLTQQLIEENRMSPPTPSKNNQLKS